MKREDQTPEQRAEFIERRKARDRAKSKRRRDECRVAKITASPLRTVNKTDPVTRRRLHGTAPEMSKNRLRAMLSEALRHTAGASST